MPNLNAKRFAQADTLQKIKRECLLKWLQPHAAHLASRGATLPTIESNEAVDYEKLAAVFVDPDEDMPPTLAESVFMIDEMATPEGMDAILDGAEAAGVTLNVGDEPEPADVAVQAWLEKPDLFEQLHDEHQLNRPKSFSYFMVNRDDVPPFTPPTAEQIRALEARLEAWYVKKKRGPGCKVLVYPKSDECWFLVRHGQPCKREGAMQDGVATSVFYRPQKHDVLVYNSALGELRINCCGVRERNEFREAFGVHLFGDDKIFSGDAKYTLAPIVNDGENCLACADIDGMASVTLKEVEFHFPGKPGQRVIRKSDDIFALVRVGPWKWPDAELLKRAVFEIAFSETKKTRRVTIAGSNRAMYGRDDDSVIVERWLKARGFMGEANESDNE